MTKVRILLADDHPRFPQLVASLLGPSFEVVGQVADGRSLCEAAGNLKPDVIVTDISMPILDGIAAADELKKSSSKSKIIFLTAHADPDFVSACLATGALGFVLKTRMATDLVLAIREALLGRIFVSPPLGDTLRG